MINHYTIYCNMKEQAIAVIMCYYCIPKEPLYPWLQKQYCIIIPNFNENCFCYSMLRKSLSLPSNLMENKSIYIIPVVN